jgi:putative colanic acid biosynthesis acetyltransferase WcaF
MLDIEQNRRARKYPSGEMIRRVMWKVAQPVLRLSPRPCFGWRRFLLRCLGAKIGRGVHVYPSATIYFPWNLEAGDESAIGELAFCLQSRPSHDRRSRDDLASRSHLRRDTRSHQAGFPLLRPSITIGPEASVCAGAFVGPGVTIGEAAIVGARAVAIKDVNPWTIVVGNPARESKRPEITQ